MKKIYIYPDELSSQAACRAKIEPSKSLKVTRSADRIDKSSVSRQSANLQARVARKYRFEQLFMIKTFGDFNLYYADRKKV